MEDEFLNSTMSSKQSRVDFKGKGTLLRGFHGGNVTIDEGGKIGYTDLELHSNPELYYTRTKRKATKLKKTKPKQKEFRVGRIRSSNEVLNKESKAEGNLGAGNIWFKGRVYSRRSKKIPVIDIEKGKEVLGETTLEDKDIGDCQGVEDHQLDFCQSTEDLSSNNFESDNEALLCTEADTEGEWEKAEEKGFEGFRCLMESKMEDDNISVGNKRLSIGDPLDQRGEGSDPDLQGIILENAGAQIRVGKMSISSSQIKEVAGALTLKVIQNEAKPGYKEDQSKISSSTNRRKGGDRELRNLECSIDFDKRRKVRGPRIKT